jgi:hypothetical protein
MVGLRAGPQTWCASEVVGPARRPCDRRKGNDGRQNETTGAFCWLPSAVMGDYRRCSGAR